jgi:sarcosine oxidase
MPDQPGDRPDRRQVVAGAAALAGLASCQSAPFIGRTMPDVAVIGAGAAGSAAALHLARAGAKVTLYDQYAFGHEHGSSHGATRLFRTAYFEHPNYVPILQRARRLWLEIEKDAGEKLFYQEGVIEAGPPDGPFLKGLRAAIAEHDLPVIDLDAAALKRDHPQLKLPGNYEAVFEHEAGFVLAGKTVAHQIRLAKAAGARLSPQTAILGWEPSKDGVTVRTAAGAVSYDRLVIAAGAWANGLLNLPKADVKPWPRTLFWRRPDTDDFNVGGGFSPFGIETDDERFFYGFPAIDADGVKIAEHTGGNAIARPEDRTDTPDPGEAEAIDDFLAEMIPALANKPGSFQRCLYEVSPDHHFIIDRHPLSDRVVFAAGLSGHGFKFAPVLGETLSIMTLEDRTPAEWAFLSMQRFG